jgi:hypothetical protein
MTPATLTVRARDLPGRVCGEVTDVHVGLQVGKEPWALVPGDASEAAWQVEVHVTETGDLRGPAVHGPRGERFLYLTWVDGSGTMFSRTKLMLAGVAGSSEAEVSLTDARGRPRTGRLKDLVWRQSPSK